MTPKEYLEKEKSIHPRLKFACWQYSLDDALIDLMQGFYYMKLSEQVDPIEVLKWYGFSELEAETVVEQFKKDQSC